MIFITAITEIIATCDALILAGPTAGMCARFRDWPTRMEINTTMCGARNNPERQRMCTGFNPDIPEVKVPDGDAPNKS